jgi:hypothetical protein
VRVAFDVRQAGRGHLLPNEPARRDLVQHQGRCDALSGAGGRLGLRGREVELLRCLRLRWLCRDADPVPVSGRPRSESMPRRRPIPSVVHDRATGLDVELRLTRRQLLKAAGLAAMAWQARPWLASPPAWAQAPPDDPLVVVPTLEAFADTIIPGEKRSPTDRAIAGAASGPGAVHAGALGLMSFPPAGVAPALPAFASDLNQRATAYAGAHGIVLDPTVPPLVSLDFAARTALVVEILDSLNPDQLAYYALAALVFLAYHTAGHLSTAAAVRGGHPGLAAIGFPQPDADDLWRHPVFSYRRALAKRHPLSKRGSPA